MRKNGSIYLLVALLVLVGLGVWILVTPTPERTAPPTPYTPADPAQPATSSPDVDPTADWSSSIATTSDLQVTITHPPAASVEAVQRDIYELKYIGPDSEPATEITDGYYTSWRFIEQPQPVYLTESVDATTTATTIAGRDAVRYATTSALGNQVTAYAVAASASTTLLINVTISGSAADQAAYEAEVRQILNALTITPVETGDLAPLSLNEPAADQTIELPLTVIGEAPGTWFFEGSFPLRLVDESGTELASGIAEADGDWMREEPVAFRGTLEATEGTAAAPAGAVQLILEKANPSGLPENAASRTVPLRLE